jgi:hypothetical protein
VRIADGRSELAKLPAKGGRKGVADWFPHRTVRRWGGFLIVPALVLLLGLPMAIWEAGD